ncbi:MAG: bifunctional diguanylate cyclase/phosphodiesterase [Pseudomonadota bacterium]
MYYRGSATSPKSVTSSALEQTVKAARHALLAVFVLASIVVTGLTAAQLATRAQMNETHASVRQMDRLGLIIRMCREKMTNLVTTKSLTGNVRMRDEYEQHASKLTTALADLTALAASFEFASAQSGRSSGNPGAAPIDMFDPSILRQMRLDAAVLSEIERRAMRMASAGMLNDAQTILQSPGHAQHIAALNQKMSRLDRSIEAKITAIFNHSAWLEGLFQAALILISMLISFVLWRYLNKSVEATAEQARTAEDVMVALRRHNTFTGFETALAHTERVTALIASPEAESTGVSVLSMDIHGLREIQNTRGREAGHYVLAEVARRIRASIGRADEVHVGHLETTHFSIARFGRDRDQMVDLAERITATLTAPMTHENEVFTIRVEMGAATYPDDAQTASILMRHADIATGPTGTDSVVRFFEDSLNTEIQERLSLVAGIERGIGAGEFEPYFQPLVDLSTNRIRGFEVLTRWNHPDRGMIMPNIFIPLAEDNNLVPGMTYAVLREALKTALNWPGQPFLAVNISPGMLSDPWLQSNVEAILAETRFPANRLELEITENAIIDDMEKAREIMSGLKARGISIALDDFGTGHSSLSSLANLPFDKIKLDRSFVRTMESNAGSAKIVDAVVGLGLTMGLKTTAEGIETAADRNILKALACTYGQGYYWSKPVPADEALDQLRICGRSDTMDLEFVA